MTNHLLVDSPNRVTPQGGWPRRGVAAPSGTCIVHTSEGPWQNGVNALTQFIRTRADYGSYHRACDWADIAVYYPWEWEAWQDSETNPWAVGIAAACKTSDWAIMPADIREGYYRNMGRMAADFVAYMRDTHGVHVPLRRITGAQARARVPGFCAHGDSGVSRSDPGAAFDWGYFFKCTREALGAGSISPQSGNITPAKPIDPLEETMAFFKSREEFGNWLQQQVVKAPIKSTDGKVWPLHSHIYGITMRQQQAAARQAGQDEVLRQILEQSQNIAIDYTKVEEAAERGAATAQVKDNEALAKAIVDEQAERLTKEQP